MPTRLVSISETHSVNHPEIGRHLIAEFWERKRSIQRGRRCRSAPIRGEQCSVSSTCGDILNTKTRNLSPRLDEEDGGGEFEGPDGSSDVEPIAPRNRGGGSA
jgi:hypothetical protein